MSEHEKSAGDCPAPLFHQQLAKPNGSPLYTCMKERLSIGIGRGRRTVVLVEVFLRNAVEGKCCNGAL